LRAISVVIAPGYSVALSGDGDTAVVGGPHAVGAAWVFVQPLEVSPYSGIAASGTQGGPFSPSSFSYKLRATSGSVDYAIANVPSWLTASSTSGTLTTANTTITFAVNSNADTLAPGAYVGSINFNNTVNRRPGLTPPRRNESRGYDADRRRDPAPIHTIWLIVTRLRLAAGVRAPRAGRGLRGRRAVALCRRARWPERLICRSFVCAALR
jgi:hypothetical protein